MSLKGKRALVCGASAGIGRAIAIALAAEGAELIVLARRAQRLSELCAEIAERGGSAVPLVCDLDKRDAVVDSLAPLLSRPVHILINNAGGPKGGPILEASAESFLEAFNRHILASHRLTQTLLPGMTEAGYGRIINIISTSVYEPIPNLGVSNTTRGAMAAWAKSVSRELPPGVTINNVLPGFTDTERLDSLRAGRAARTRLARARAQ